jgi:hypothetical protein
MFRARFFAPSNTVHDLFWRLHKELRNPPCECYVGICPPGRSSQCQCLFSINRYG